MKIYNMKYKDEFIERYNTQKSKEMVRWLFGKSFKFENEIFGKDLLDFNKEQIAEFLGSRKMSPETLTTFLRYISMYMEFGIEKGYKRISKNPISEVGDDFVIKLAKKNNRKYFHYAQIEEMVGLKDHGYNYPKLKNIQDLLLIYLTFLGVSGKDCSELRNIKYSDVDKDNQKITLYSSDGEKREITVFSFVMDWIEEGKDEKDYVKYVDYQNSYSNRIPESQTLNKTNYIFQSSKVGKTGDDLRLNRNTVFKRLDKIAGYLGERLTFTNIEKSGQLYFAYLILSKLTDAKLNIATLKQGNFFKRYNIQNERTQFTVLQFLKKELPNYYPELADRIK